MGTIKEQLSNYDPRENKITIHGCYDCPFNRDISNEVGSPDAYCLLDDNIDPIDWGIDVSHKEYFPEECPLRDPNFSLLRIIN